ncbi:sorting nexin-7 [Rhinophrynus dorsalis]
MESESRAPFVPVSPGCVSSEHSSLLTSLPLSPDSLRFDEDDDDLEVFSKDITLMDGNSPSPLMLASPSSMINQYRFDDEPEVKDIFTSVDDPESHITAIETFITYRVATKTSRSQFDSSEFEVRRRYQDFLWLKSRLEDAHPTLIIPPLPEKFIVKGMVERFNDEFIETRRKALHKFLNRIADHPTLTFNEDFKIFLTAQAWELTSHKKQGPGLLSRMGQTIKAVASSVRGFKNRPEEFTELVEYVDTFSQKINVLDKISQRIYKEQKDYYEALKEYGPIYTLWSASEEDLVDSLKGVASCIDKCCNVTDVLNSKLSGDLIPIIHEYVLYSDTLSGVLKRRDQIQMELDTKVEALTNKKGDGDTLKQEIEKLEDKVECANNALKADWERWKQNMQTDLNLAFTSMAESRISHYEECLATWESFLSSQTCNLQLGGKQENKS